MLVTVQCTGPREPYTFVDAGPHLVLHLAPSTDRGAGACLCGFDRHATDANGRALYGFSVGGGVSGGRTEHFICPTCVDRAGNAPIHGTHSGLFSHIAAVLRDRNDKLWQLGHDGLLHAEGVAATSREQVERRWGPLVPVRLECPECRDGKHRNCTGWTLDDADRVVGCACACATSKLSVQ